MGKQPWQGVHRTLPQGFGMSIRVKIGTFNRIWHYQPGSAVYLLQHQHRRRTLSGHPPTSPDPPLPPNVMDQAQCVRRLTDDSKYLRKILRGKLDSTRTKILTAKTNPFLAEILVYILMLNKRNITWYKYITRYKLQYRVQS